MPIIVHTLAALNNSGCVDEIIVAAHKADIDGIEKLFKRFRVKRVKKVVRGGRTRTASVANALAHVSGDTDIVLIHDGVRPFADKKMIGAAVSAAKASGAAVCGVPVVPTVKFVDKMKCVIKTPERSGLYEIQTPQVFKKDIIIKAYAAHAARKGNEGAHDDSSLVERMGRKVVVTPGSRRNIKITTREDLAVARGLI